MEEWKEPEARITRPQASGTPHPAACCGALHAARVAPDELAQESSSCGLSALTLAVEERPVTRSLLALACVGWSGQPCGNLVHSRPRIPRPPLPDSAKRSGSAETFPPCFRVGLRNTIYTDVFRQKSRKPPPPMCPPESTPATFLPTQHSIRPSNASLESAGRPGSRGTVRGGTRRHQRNATPGCQDPRGLPERIPSSTPLMKGAPSQSIRQKNPCSCDTGHVNRKMRLPPRPDILCDEGRTRDGKPNAVVI